MADGDYLLSSSIGSREIETDARSATLRRMVAQLVLDTTNEGIWLIDAQARTTFVNRHAADLLGYTEDEMIGMHIFAFMDEERRPTTERNLMRRQQGIEERHEVKLRRKDGTPIWVLGSVNPVFDQQGRYAGSLALLGDLTAQKDTQRLHLRIEELGRQLSSRTLEEDVPCRSRAEEPYREPFRTAIVLGTCATLLATVALLTAGGVVSALLRPAASASEVSEF